jgi:hypothetical protein
MMIATVEVLVHASKRANPVFAAFMTLQRKRTQLHLRVTRMRIVPNMSRVTLFGGKFMTQLVLRRTFIFHKVTISSMKIHFRTSQLIRNSPDNRAYHHWHDINDLLSKILNDVEDLPKPLRESNDLGAWQPVKVVKDSNVPLLVLDSEQR